MRAIDIYSGIGGWTSGLRLSGIDVVGSYEWWPAAVDTNNANNGGHSKPVDVRSLDLNSIPNDIDLVVGSPPCTQFSYANRGGQGDLDEGLKDIVRFFEIVQAVKPRFWAMENVPRVAKILGDGFSNPKHVLYQFRNLHTQIAVLDFSKFGTPQTRKRCIAGNFPLEKLIELSAKCRELSLGQVVDALSEDDQIKDPNWGIELPAAAVTEIDNEEPLRDEERRLNWEAKAHHPVYNNMAFPDDMNAPARTITATCTRVSRESIIVSDPDGRGYRRLSIRERATLQGFPITYQFFGTTHSQKVKMIGNAVPPTFSFLVGLAVQDAVVDSNSTFSLVSRHLRLPPQMPPATKPEMPTQKYRANRRFRAAIPGLRFKSGVRFELCNHFTGDGPGWSVKFVHGTPKDIRELHLDAASIKPLWRSQELEKIRSILNSELLLLSSHLQRTSNEELQAAWSKRVVGPSPFEIVDELGEVAGRVARALQQSTLNDVERIILDIVSQCSEDTDTSLDNLPRSEKLKSNAVAIAAGLLVGECFNRTLRPSANKVAA